MGVSNQSAIVIVFAVITIIFVIPVAYGFTISSMVGQAIGLGEIDKARKTMWLCLLSCLFTMSIVVAFIHQYGRSYLLEMTDNEEIVDKAFANLKVYTVVYFVDGLQQCMLSMIKALGM